ncbi:peptide deformylase [bacterium]|nr:peptide deformylase [bacterium]
MEILKILTTENSEALLRSESRKLDDKEIVSKKIQDFIDELLYTAENAKMQSGWESAGLAAIQVGRPVQLFIAKDLMKNEFNVYINPEIEFLGSAKDIKLEGCLSIPEISGMVERHKRIRIRYKNREGITQVAKVDGFNARIIQHEYDHLHGVLFTDKLI